ncbi:hypothetical protein SISSUDRAFT_1067079 [Sistotremastrum suecicum HHB10207 ss-3]|uniref:Uncharacterized protein n=1 Tax=Sistotremastrum suecicum HHB10207 ss-3 TaxID=1314776 RepID=A0A165XJM8_9AGAM|nr:hypothetical protein SISSUDRAFT_1067079 [Sistotremastrum suecicum HHB10207 ss-3]
MSSPPVSLPNDIRDRPRSFAHSTSTDSALPSMSFSTLQSAIPKAEPQSVDQKLPIPLAELQDTMRLYTDPVRPRFLSSPIFQLTDSLNVLVYSLNVHTHPSYAPELSASALQRDPKLHLFTHPQLFTPSYPWAPLIPLMPRVDVTVLAPLRYQSPWPLERINHKFSLSPTLISEWRDIHLRLQRVVDVLRNYCLHSLPSKSWQRQITAQLVIPPPPSRFGFEQHHRHAEVAQRQCFLSHVTFRLWLGLVLLFMKMLPPVRPTDLPQWFHALAKAGFSSAWLNDFQTSNIFRDSLSGPRRPGAFIDMNAFRDHPVYQPLLSLYLDLQVPLYYRWNDEIQQASLHRNYSNWLAPFRPLSTADLRPICISSILNRGKPQRPPPPLPLADDSAPELSQYLLQGQLRRFLHPPSYEQRQRSEALAAFHDQSLSSYCLAVSTVYEWLQDLPGGRWRQTLVPTSLKLVAFSQYPRHRRVYVPEEDTWHLCLGFRNERFPASPVPLSTPSWYEDLSVAGVEYSVSTAIDAMNHDHGSDMDVDLRSFDPPQVASPPPLILPPTELLSVPTPSSPPNLTSANSTVEEWLRERFGFKPLLYIGATDHQTWDAFRASFGFLPTLEQPEINAPDLIKFLTANW